MSITSPFVHPGRGATRFAAVTALLVLSACSTTPPPREQLAVTRAAVDRASGPAAAEAPVALAAAREKLERANVAMAQKEYELARQLAEQAEADAALAEAQSRAVRSNKALGEVRESIRLLREQMSRG